MRHGLTCALVGVGVGVGTYAGACEPEADVCLDVVIIIQVPLNIGSDTVVCSRDVPEKHAARLHEMVVIRQPLEYIVELAYRTASLSSKAMSQTISNVAPMC